MIGSDLAERRAAPARRKTERRGFLAVVVALLVVWNVLANLLPTGAQLPTSVVATVLLVVVARRSGLDWSQVGLARRDLANGVRVGVIGAGVVILVLIAAAAIPATLSVLADGRFVAMELPRALYEMLVRIPLAVALAEEVAFRGVLLGMLIVRTTALRAIVISSLVFGLWHVLPAITALETTAGLVETSSAGAELGLVAGQVILTGLAGLAFCWLRLRGRHLSSAILVHAPLNSVSFAVGWLAVQHAWA